MNLARKLWVDEAGVVVSTEIILIVLILVLGLIAGLTNLRDMVTQELADLGEAINHLDGSYEFVAPVHDPDAAGGTVNTGPATEYDDSPDSNNTQNGGADNAPDGIDLDQHNDTSGGSGEDGGL